MSRELSRIVSGAAGVLLVALASNKLCTDFAALAWFALAMVGWVMVMVAVLYREKNVDQQDSGTIRVRHIPYAVPSSDEHAGPVYETKLPADAKQPAVTRAALAEDLSSALLNLGYKKKTADELTEQTLDRFPEATLEELVEKALSAKWRKA